MNPEIFKEYDIRGIWTKDFDAKDAEMIAEAFCEVIKPKSVVIGHDHRFGSEIIARAVEKACSNYCNVYSIDLTTTPMFYFTLIKKKSAGIMITASHNPKEYNGMKFIGNHLETIGKEEGLNKIKEVTLEKLKDKLYSFEKSKKSKHKINHYNPFNDYLNFLSKFSTSKNTSFVLDCGNGVGFIDAEILRRLGYNVETIFEKPNPEFPNHIADPSKEETLRTLQLVCKNERKIGFALDGDCDRFGLVDETGEIVKSDIIAAMIIDKIVKKDKVVLTVNMGKVAKEIAEEKGKLIVSKVGRTNVKEAMVSNNAKFGGEESGHFYFKEFNYFDSGIFSILTILKVIGSNQDGNENSNQNSNQNINLHEMIKKYKKYKNEEYSIELKLTGNPEKDKELKSKIMKEIKNEVEQRKPKELKTIDGVNADFGKYWFTIRPSNTEPLLRVTLECEKSEDIERIKKEINSIVEEAVNM